MNAFQLYLLGVVALIGCAEHRAEEHVARLGDTDRRVRLDASYELVQLGSSSVEPILRAAQNGSDRLQYVSVQILGRIGDARAIPFLRDRASASNIHIRREAVIALGMMGEPGLLAPLAGILIADGDRGVRSAAARGISNFLDTTAVPSLISALRDREPEVRREALSSLNRLWTVAAEIAVIAALREDEDETVRYIAAQALGHHQATLALEALKTATLEDSSTWVRVEAVRALGNIGDPRVTPELERVLRSYDGQEQEAAVEALQQLTGVDYVVIP
ncbi:MAG: HEAT repeat domain-containing protein [Candidatus Latescibacterota bacterium]|nr:HEAT repeat domain-containing protein [Candidatus Latescibacterota bacterium]